MKRWFFVLALLAGFQYREQLRAWIDPPPPPPVVAAEHEVRLYGTSWCGYCKAMRRFLDDKGIAYREFDIETSAQGKAEYDRLGGQGVPVLLVNETVIHGYNPDGVLAALN